MASRTLAAPCFVSLTVPELQGCTQAELARCSRLPARIQAVPTPQPGLPPALHCVPALDQNLSSFSWK